MNINSTVQDERMKPPLTLNKDTQHPYTSFYVITEIKTINPYKDWNLLTVKFINSFLPLNEMSHMWQFG